MQRNLPCKCQMLGLALGCCVDVGTVLKQQPHHHDVVVLRSFVQCSVTPPVKLRQILQDSHATASQPRCSLTSATAHITHLSLLWLTSAPCCCSSRHTLWASLLHTASCNVSWLGCAVDGADAITSAHVLWPESVCECTLVRLERTATVAMMARSMECLGTV
jgi:hypothetical protein